MTADWEIHKKAINALPPLRETIKKHQLRTKKDLGQHFLLDLNLTDRIAREVPIKAGDAVVEIGPGPGGLTRQLLCTPLSKLIVIEHDVRCIAVMEELKAIVGDRLEIVHADALEVDEFALAQGAFHIISNLPYNIGTELLFKWLGNLEYISSMTLMFQKEVAMRVVAETGVKAYGRVSVLSQWLCNVRHCLDVHPDCFSPPPKVDSSVIQLLPKPSVDAVHDRKKLELVIKTAFGQRRKTIRASLKSIDKDIVSVLESIGIDPMLRAENLTFKDYISITNALT